MANQCDCTIGRPSEFLVLREAVPAIHRPAFGRLERNFAFLSAVRTDSRVHFARATVATAASASPAASAAPAASATASTFAVIVVAHLSTYFPPEIMPWLGRSTRAVFRAPFRVPKFQQSHL